MRRNLHYENRIRIDNGCGLKGLVGRRYIIVFRIKREVGEACMPRYEYRNIQPLPVAEKAFLDWIQKLDEQFANRNIEHRCLVVRNALHELYLGRPYADPAPDSPLAEQALV